jgi:hypothetical protein
MAYFTLRTGIISRFLSVPRPRALSPRAQSLDLWKSVERARRAGAEEVNFGSTLRPAAVVNLHELRGSRNDHAQTIEKA